jgi:hypothetical protein
MKRLLFALLAVVAAGCSKTNTPARAFQIQSRADLIGGKRALADIGDFKVSNGVIQAIVQNVGSSRGFGAFGGSLIDVDLVRGNKENGAQGPNGNDYFTEMFPAFFLTAIEPDSVSVLADGSDGNAAIIRVAGHGNNFISLVKGITDLVNPRGDFNYTCDYILEPGKQYLKLVTTITNPGTSADGYGLQVPFGFITLLGEGQKLFVPGGAGFDMRFYLEDVAYKRDASLTALPGVVSSMWSTAGNGVSYALVAARPSDGNYVENKPTYYPNAKGDDLLIPIASSSFLGSFWATAPASIAPKGSYSYTGYLAVGSGDVASVQKVAYDLRDTVTRSNGKEAVIRDATPYGTISGLVRERPTMNPLKNISVVLQDEAGNYVSQALTTADGRWTAPVPPGKYKAIAVDDSRPSVTSDAPVEVTTGGSAELNLEFAQLGQLQVIVRDEQGRDVPAKISVEGIYDNPTGVDPRHFLYDLKVGERYRVSDLDPDVEADPQTRRYLERILFAAHGAVGTPLKPGHYRVFASRGPEYDLPSQEVDVAEGKTATVALKLTQVMPTPGWLSGDFHVHSANSVDSDMALPERVTSYAVEGVDFLSSTDHNYVSDFAPTIEALNLADWVRSVVGLELTTLEMGHFNAFPLVLQPGPVQHGSFKWFFRPPGELFAQLRGLGVDPQHTVVQVNHPRDTVLGYMNAFNFGTYTGQPLQPSSFSLDQTPQADGTPSPYAASNFSLDYDAMEIFNSKRLDNVHSYRIPTTPVAGVDSTLPRCSSAPNLPSLTQDCIPEPGEVLEKIGVTLDGGTVRQPAYPGSQDDWFTLLAQGRRYTATGNSDSHSAGAEAGLPRTYLEVGDTADRTMRSLDPQAPIDALLQGHAVVTNGPFLQAWVNGQGVGRTVVAPDGSISVHVKVQAPPWMDVSRVVVRRGGKDQGKSPLVLETITVTEKTAVTRLDVTRSYTGIPDDSFIVVEVQGDQQMWPIFTPHEVPSLQISDAVGVIGGAFGFGNKYGKYTPSQKQQVVPYGFTNPIWVNRSDKQGLSAPKKVLGLSSSATYTPRRLSDLTRLYHAFHSDP